MIPIDGFPMELKDKRVTKIAKKHGYEEGEIFYSPINAWFVFAGILFLVSFPISIYFLINYLYIFLAYFIVSYFIVGVLNRSFVLTEKDLLIINSQFSFRKLESIKFEEIIEIEITSDWKLRLLLIFGVFYNNYIRVTTTSETRKFYCLFLDFDCYDENITEKNLDDFGASISQKGVNVYI